MLAVRPCPPVEILDPLQEKSRNLSSFRWERMSMKGVLPKRQGFDYLHRGQ